jgi:hypothetical protein
MTERQQNVRAAIAIVLLLVGILVANLVGRASEPPPETHTGP